MSRTTEKCYRSPRLAVLHKTAQSLHRVGQFDKETMRGFDAACLTPVEQLPASEKVEPPLRFDGEPAAPGGPKR